MREYREVETTLRHPEAIERIISRALTRMSRYIQGACAFRALDNGLILLAVGAKDDRFEDILDQRLAHHEMLDAELQVSSQGWLVFQIDNNQRVVMTLNSDKSNLADLIRAELQRLVDDNRRANAAAS